MGRLFPIALVCAIVGGCSTTDDRRAPDAAAEPITPAPDTAAAARASPLELLLDLAPRLATRRDQALLLVGVGEVFARSGRSDRAADAFERAQRALVDDETTIEIAVRGVAAGLDDRAIAIAATIKDDAARGAALEQVVRALVDAGQLELAHATAERLTSARWIRAQAAVAEGFARAGRKTEAAGALRRALEVREAQGEEILDPVDTAELARVCALVWGGETPRELFDGAFDRVSRKARARLAEPARLAALVEIIGRYAAAGEIDDALEQAEKLKSDLHAVRAMVMIAVVHREQGRMKQGFDVLGDALRRAERMRTSCAKVEAIADVTVGYSRISATDKISWTAEKALESLEQIRGRERTTCRDGGESLRALAGAGACDALWRHVDLIEDLQQLIDVLIDNGGRCLAARTGPGAVRMLIRADELITAHGLGDKAPQLATVARHLARAGEYDRAHETAEKIDPQSPNRINALAWIVEGYLANAVGEMGSDRERDLLDKVRALTP
jgi:tetratricopeptide (TPR) repeat protein